MTLRIPATPTTAVAVGAIHFLKRTPGLVSKKAWKVRRYLCGKVVYTELRQPRLAIANLKDKQQLPSHPTLFYSYSSHNFRPPSAAIEIDTEALCKRFHRPLL